MKRYVSVCFLLLFCGVMNDLHSQCVKPTPMNAQQIKSVSGKWKGSYTYKGDKKDIEIRVYIANNKEVVCDVRNPPLEGKETFNEYFFCPGGEFHLKKYIGDLAYVFQGVPENDQIKGILSIYTSDTKRTQGGNFTIKRIE